MQIIKISIRREQVKRVIIADNKKVPSSTVVFLNTAALQPFRY